MKKLSTIEIRSSVTEALNQVLTTLEVPATSKKTKKTIGSASKKITEEVKRVLKKEFKKEEKAMEKMKKKTGKSSKSESGPKK